MVHLLTRKSWLKTLFPPTAVNTLAKMNGHQTHQTLTLLITMSGELCVNATRQVHPKPKNIGELMNVLQVIRDQLPQGSVNKAIVSFIKRLQAYLKAGDGHFEHAL